MLSFSARQNYHRLIGKRSQSDWLYWVLAVLFGAASGFVHVRINDSGLSVLMVTGFTMFLAYRRPRLSWWWAGIIGLSLPFAVLLSDLLFPEKPSLGMLAGSFAGMAFAVVASVGGKVLRRVVQELFPPKKQEPVAPSETKQEHSATPTAMH